MEYMLGACGAFGVLALFSVWRLHQFSSRYRKVLAKQKSDETCTILMLDHYHGSEELKLRLEMTAYYYHDLASIIPNIKILLTTGKLMGEAISVAGRNRDTLIALGVPKGDIHIYLGQNGRGAADTYEEIGLACEWLGTRGEKSIFIVANPLQAFHAYYLAVFNSILPHLRPVELLEIETFYMVGKLFQAILVLFDPRGWNPFSCWIRYRRRYIISTF